PKGFAGGFDNNLVSWKAGDLNGAPSFLSVAQDTIRVLNAVPSGILAATGRDVIRLDSVIAGSEAKTLIGGSEVDFRGARLPLLISPDGAQLFFTEYWQGDGPDGAALKSFKLDLKSLKLEQITSDNAAQLSNLLNTMRQEGTSLASAKRDEKSNWERVRL